jgi:hypothetical protein
MAKVQHYRGLHTDLDQLYEAIKKRDRESAESVNSNGVQRNSKRFTLEERRRC